MSQILYNGTSYTIELKLKTKIKNKNLIFNKDTGYYEYNLCNDNLIRMDMINDLFIPAPTITLEYRDLGNVSVANFAVDSSTRIEYYFKNNVRGTVIKHDFIVDDIELMNKEMRQSTYLITGKSELYLILNSFVKYSTCAKSDTNSLKECTKIIKEILIKSKYPFFEDEDSNMDTDQKIFYIAPNNTKILDNIEHLIQLSISPTNGIFYLIYDMNKAKGKLLSLNKLYQNIDNKIASYNNFYIPSEFGTADNEFTVVYDPVFNSLIKGTGQILQSSTIKLNNFNYLDRSWNKDVYDYKRIMKMLPKINKEDYTKITPEYGNQDQYTMQKGTTSYNEVFNKANSLCKFTEDLQFNTFGIMDRSVGQLAIVDTNDPTVKQRFSGVWMIARMIQTYDRTNYLCNVTLVRNDKLKGY